ncbi:MAG: 3-dehydroquinate synthase [Candidatus Hydrogenedentes bacterium]|nr:3-dehydroquinate synthase [Candidatus Hydrogenedentota bacterium]
MISTVIVELGDRSYPIHIGRGAVDRLPETLASLRAKGAAAIVTDSNVAPLHSEPIRKLVEAAGLKPALCVMPAGEENKRLTQIDLLCGNFLEGGLDRSSIVIALGGGIVGDVAGFAAATFMRGIRFIQIPTTIVAQVDSSVGGKTAVNHALAKNIIGAFHQPSTVLSDLNYLSTLPLRELRAGLAEAIKHGIIEDEGLFEFMERNAPAILAKDLTALETPVRRSCEIKSAIVAEDEREEGRRANLNYGHTFGHGIEAVTGYKQFLHGEAIALGMIAAGALAEDLGLVDAAFVERQKRCLEAYGLPVAWNEIPVDETLALMKHDKKARAGTMKFIVVDRMGHAVQRTDITEAQARRALEALKTG